MHGIFQPNGPLSSPSPEFEELCEGPAFALYRERGCSDGQVHRQGDLTACLFGEIYNLADVVEDRTADEVSLLCSLLRDPRLPDLLPRLNGSFLIVAHDAAVGRLLLVSDRIGSLECHYAFRDGRLSFARRAAWLNRPGFRSCIDRDFALQWLTFRFVGGDRTPIEGVRCLPPGTLLECSGETLALRPYWSCHYNEDAEAPGDEVEAADRLGELLLQAVERRVAGPSRLVIPISGGLDSRALLGATLEGRSADDIETVTIGQSGVPDIELGRLVARTAGVRHRQIDMAAPHDYEQEYARQAVESDGVADVVGQFFLSDWEAMGAFSNTIVSGHLGGFLAGCCFHTGAERARTDERADRQSVLRSTREGRLEDVARLLGLTRNACEDLLTDVIARTDHANHHRLLGFYAACWSFNNRSTKLIGRHVLKRRAAFDYLLPLADTALMDYQLRLPIPMLRGRRLFQLMLVRRFPALAALPTVRSGGRPLAQTWAGSPKPGAVGRLGNSVRRQIEKLSLGLLPLHSRDKERARLDRQKYLDYRKLLREEGPFRSLCERKLRRLAERGLLEADAITDLWAEHLSGRRSHEMCLILLTGLEFVFESFVDRQA